MKDGDGEKPVRPIVSFCCAFINCRLHSGLVIFYILSHAFVSRLQVEDDEQVEQEYEDDFEVMPHFRKPAVEFAPFSLTACVHLCWSYCCML